MKLCAFVFLLVTLSLNTFSQTSYYNQGSSIPVTYSTTIMCVKFVTGLSNTDKQIIIADSEGTLMNDNWDSIPDYVQIKSILTRHTERVYPCGNPEFKTEKIKDTFYSKPIVSKLPPCQGENCPPDCTPYVIITYTNNFEDVISYLLQNLNIISASPAGNTSNQLVGTAEDFYIKIKPNYTIADFSSLLTINNAIATDVSALLGSSVYKISINRTESRYCFQKANAFYQSGMCDFSTPNFYQFGTCSQSNDPYFAQQWNIQNTGQNGYAGDDVRAVPAWNISKGSGITVAIVDDGVIDDHPDLSANMLQGYNAEDHSSSGIPYLKNNHGTRCAGIVAAVADNNIGLTGVAPKAKILPVRIYTETSNRFIASAMGEGIQWAWQHGADVLNFSWGGGLPNDLITNSINNATTLGRGGKGCVIAASTGNLDLNFVYYPALLDNVIACGMMSMCNERKNPQSCDNYPGGGSHYGPQLDVMAPGAQIITTDAFNAIPYTGDFGGTSAAAPHVAATAALMLAVNPNLTGAEVRRILNFSCNKVGKYCYNWNPSHPDGMWNGEMGYGRINAYNAVQLARSGVTISTPQYNIPGVWNSQVSNNLGIIFSNAICPITVSGGVSFVKRFEVTTPITFPYTNNPIILCTSNGFNLSNPCDGKGFAEAINVTNTSAVLRTYVYYAYTSIGQQLGWIPAAPGNIGFTFSVISSPTPTTYQTQKGNFLNNEEIKRSNYPFNLELDPAPKKNDISYEFNTIQISPSPAATQVSIKFLSEDLTPVKAQLFNMSGQKVDEKTYSSTKGLNSITFDIQNLPSGIYMVKLEGKSYKFLKN